MKLKVAFGSYLFHEQGVPHYGESTAFESGSDGRSRIARKTFTIKQHFEEESFSDNQARIQLLNEALIAGEAVLFISDENDVVIYRGTVKVKSSDVPTDEWRQRVSEVTVQFESRELLDANTTSASFVPTGDVALVLANITGWQESVRTERHSDERDNRKKTIISISASGIIMADQSLPMQERLQDLQAKQALMRKTHSRSGELTYGSETRLVKVERLDGDFGDGSDRLEWSLDASYTTYPDGDYAEIDFEVSTRDDITSGERVFLVRGEIRADTEQRAKTRLETLKNSYASPGRSLTASEINDQRVSGGDGDTWITLNFNFEYREAISDVLSWDLSVSTKEEVRSADVTITYEGRVVGKTAAAAMSKASVLGANQLPFMISSNLSLSTRQVEGQSEQFVEVQFNFDYLTKSEWKYAEVTREMTQDKFGEQKEIISGFAVAKTLALAETLGRTFQLPGRLLRDQSESYAEREAIRPSPSADTAHAVRFDFSYTYYLTPTTASISYTKEDSSDYTSMERSITFSGTSYGPSAAACNALITATIGTPGGNITQRSRTDAVEVQSSPINGSYAAAGAQLLSVSFNERYVLPATGLVGMDILEAEYSLNIVYSINADVLTPIPFGQAHVQTECGWTIGVKTSSGSVTALTQNGARTWGRSKKSEAESGGNIDPPEERMTHQYVPMNGTTEKCFRMEFTYAARFPRLEFS